VHSESAARWATKLSEGAQRALSLVPPQWLGQKAGRRRRQATEAGRGKAILMAVVQLYCKLGRDRDRQHHRARGEWVICHREHAKWCGHLVDTSCLL
jgi:hypothetical protein